jgi:hypothetical protein
MHVQVNGWTRFYFPVSEFQCSGAIGPADITRVQWENKGAGQAGICVRDVRVVLRGEAPVVSSDGGD